MRMTHFIEFNSIENADSVRCITTDYFKGSTVEGHMKR